MKLKSVVVLLVMSGALFEAQAQQLYKWVDAQGVTHYSEALPIQDVDHVAFDITKHYPAANPQDDYYSIQNQLKRLQERRSQQLAEKRQLTEASGARQRTADTIYVQVNEPERDYYLPGYYPYYNSHHYPNHYNHHYPTQTYQQPSLEKPKAGIHQKAKVNRSSVAFSASH